MSALHWLIIWLGGFGIGYFIGATVERAFRHERQTKARN